MLCLYRNAYVLFFCSDQIASTTTPARSGAQPHPTPHLQNSDVSEQ